MSKVVILRGRVIKFGLILALSAVVPFVALSSPTKQSVDEPTTFDITMSEYKYVVDGQKEGDPIKLETGKPYRLVFHNMGTSEHEALFGQEPKLIGGFKHDFTNNLLEDVETVITNGHEDSGFTIGAAGLAEFELLVKQDLAIEFTLPDSKVGDWELGCFVSLDPKTATEENPGAGHYDVGMHLPVTVVKGSK